jgi:hypothetical protein
MWGNTDQANNSPIWGPVSVMLTPNTANRDNLFNNTTANAFVTNTAFSNGYTAGVFGVSVAEMLDSVTGQVASVTVTAAGTGYTVRPTVTFSDGGPDASGATAQATAKVVSGTIFNGGSNYAPGDVVTINTSGAAGATTSARFNVLTVNAASSNTVLTVSINTAGAFTTLPTRIANNDTTNTTGVGTGLVINLAFGVLAVTMTANGINYTSEPSVTFGGAGGTGSTATAALRSEQSKVPSAGWNLRKVLPNGRVQYECLVAMGSIADPGGGDTDDTQLPE